ncbi:MAG: alpha/beta hydrolase family protein [Rhodospirillaceae bacterium]
MAFLRDPTIATKYGIDPKRLAIVGHSVGGYGAARQARVDHELLGVALIDAWGAAPDPAGATPAARKEMIDSFTQGPWSHSLKVVSPDQVTDELIHLNNEQSALTFARNLTGISVLIVGAEKANGGQNKALADAIAKQNGALVQTITLPTDHLFSDHRIVLTNLLLNWLDSIK